VHRVAGTGAVREGAWSVADDTREPVARTGPGWAAVCRADGLTSAIVGLYGWDGAVVVARDANAYGSYSATPCLSQPVNSGLLITLVVLGADVARCDPAVLLAGARAEVMDQEIRIRFPDGTEEVLPVTAENG